MTTDTLSACEAAEDKSKENEILLVTLGLLHLSSEVAQMGKENQTLLNNVYREISEAMGTDVAIEMYHLFRGQQITFPVRFFNPSCIRARIAAEYDGTNIGLLAKKYDYSEKTIRRFLKKALENTNTEKKGKKK